MRIHRLFEHMFWADTELLNLFREQPGAATPDALRYFAHVLASERVWLLRLRNEDSRGRPGWPELGLEELHALATANADDFARFLNGLAEADLDVDTVYSTSEGVPYRNTTCDILVHVALHGSYHRGQIALIIRRDGGLPVNTDFITFARTVGTE
jgi:uncharacterized damage-inducible protein DinB